MNHAEVEHYKIFLILTWVSHWIIQIAFWVIFKTVIIIEILYDTSWEILQIYDPTGVIQRNTIPIEVDSRANEWKRTPSVEATFGRSNKYISSNILVRSIAEYF